jgi:hypothetical protein
MNKVNVDRFWVGMGGAAGLLVLLCTVVLLPKVANHFRLHADLGIKARELELAISGTPSRSDLDGWSRYKAELLQSQSRIASFYASNSKSLRQWFPDLLRAPDGDPARDVFVVRYQDEARSLENSLTQSSQHVVVGADEEGAAPGFNWEDLRIAHWDGIGRESERIVLRELQKRFWARQRVANLAVSGRVNLKRIVDFRFFNRLHEKFPEGGGLQGGIPLAQWPGLMPEAAGGMPRQFQETVLPGNLGRQLTFGFAVELPYSDVPKAIREVLSPGAEAAAREGMLVNLIGTHVTIRGQNPPKVKFDYEEGNEEERKAKEREILKSAGPRNVLLAVTCQVMDYDPTKMRELSGK